MLVAERKAHLRRTVRSRVREDEGGLAAASTEVQRSFLHAFPPVPGSRVALYMAIRGEAGTDFIRKTYLDAGVRPYFPRVMEDGHLCFYPDCGRDGWVRGKYGLLEPRVQPGVEGARSGFDLVVVPGVAFDRMGRRLGRGSGYYDRFLAGLAGKATTVGLAFSWRIVPEVPVDAWDVPVDAVATEDGVIRVGPAPVHIK